MISSKRIKKRQRKHKRRRKNEKNRPIRLKKNVRKSRLLLRVKQSLRSLSREAKMTL